MSFPVTNQKFGKHGYPTQRHQFSCLWNNIYWVHLQLLLLHWCFVLSTDAPSFVQWILYQNFYPSFSKTTILKTKEFSCPWPGWHTLAHNMIESLVAFMLNKSFSAATLWYLLAQHLLFKLLNFMKDHSFHIKTLSTVDTHSRWKRNRTSCTPS